MANQMGKDGMNHEKKNYQGGNAQEKGNKNFQTGTQDRNVKTSQIPADKDQKGFQKKDILKDNKRDERDLDEDE